MTVLHLTDCPLALRGDLTRWLLEIAAGVFVGQVSARVRDMLWERIQKTCKNGRATLVYSSAGEQHLSFRVHGDVWEPIDFDGIKLMLRPSVSRLAAGKASSAHGFSNAAKRITAKRFSKRTGTVQYPTDYVVLDIETTGLSPDTDQIIEIGALKIVGGAEIQTFHALLRVEGEIPPTIVKLTGITDDELAEQGKDPAEALAAFSAFLGDMPFVAHNASFDTAFLLRACKKHALPLLHNRSIDTLSLARRALPGLPDYKLKTLAARLALPQEQSHRSLGDCDTTRHLYDKLIEMLSAPPEESLD